MIDDPFAVSPENVTCADESPRTADTVDGAPGTPAGVTLFDEPDAKLSPTTFVAFTVNVYAVPFVNPDTVIGLDAPVPVATPDEGVTV